MNEEQFLDKMNSRLLIESSLNQVTFDYSWVDIYEDVIPYIDNILRNPKRFIVNEEEIVKVELAKKITVESVIHLTQHTNLIQDIDENGDVKPSKILNINKEESFDTYENRFVFTLINNMNLFYSTRLSEGFGESFVDEKKKYTYSGASLVGNMNYDISINFNNHEKTLLKPSGKKSDISIGDRLKKIKQQIDSFTCSELYQTLNKLHVSPVRSPIRKTNVILKNPNFQKATELWNYIQSYSGSGVTKNKENKQYANNGKLKKQYDELFIKTYVNTISNTSQKIASKKDIISSDINKLLETIYNMNDNVSYNDLKSIFNKCLKNINVKHKNYRVQIQKIIDNAIREEEKNIKEIFNVLK